MKGKIILIEGTDCSGKETQSKLLIEKLSNGGFKSEYFSFPKYDSPTGKIIGGPFLGKKSICEGYFKEGSSNVNPKVASLYYAADRLYNISLIQEKIDNGINVVLDRYIYSNMAHQASKYKDKNERFAMYNWIEKLEFDFLELPKPDVIIFLHTSSDVVCNLLNNRIEEKDQNESDMEYLESSEKAYLELSELYNFKVIECSCETEMRKIEDINDELFEFVWGEIYARNNSITKLKK